jgi:hypothetical protein
VRIGTVAVPGVTTGSRDEGAGVTNGTVAVPGVTRAGVAWILRDAQAGPNSDLPPAGASTAVARDAPVDASGHRPYYGWTLLFGGWI